MIIESFPYSYSPLDVFRNFKDYPYSSLLLSGIKNSSWGRYSFMAAFPYMIFKAKGRKTSLITNGQETHKTGNPFNILREIYTEQSGKQNLPSSLPFTGGMLGYFGYDMGFTLEKIHQQTTDDLNLPDCILPFYDWVLYWDHKTKESFILWINTPQDKKNRIKELLKNPTRLKKSNESLYNNSSELKSNFKKDAYLNAILKAKDYIKKGDIFQVNLSQRFSCQYNSSPFELFEKLAFINPAPFSAFLNFPEVSVISASPERFLYLKANKIHTRPIKGTRPRGKNKEEDKRLAKELLNSPKDRAELIMIIDLERNDLGKFCYYGSVGVKELVALETNPTVFHTVSTVEGKVVDGITPVDCVKHSFPGGSITGAPKVRSMEIIEELEPTKRNIYTGAIGYISFNRRMDLNISIRTIIIKNKTAYFQVGGGIVADSNPELEYEETLHKGKALAESLLSGTKEKVLNHNDLKWLL
ncbi:MAG: aminodeoxychorismate synthase component I [Candidatus Omnitrophica bacterium]|nr:aminodeoxychorismate synthase component I [Candidatus Omnitrophota bacterium]MBU1047683.1 aminodeoxychorismate synthase component I [Candidatus Omnitrophota bacterium]MBU1631219.1 aminodeoxychorismate synthase component I [Candidatus Omnitrophota bacterium]MBU1766495.1 aminodeoxychorismate synthase component I [Candidatus Omnitrophota bacterium]MBU1888587.1 aminodeoxychorismate synthase component I [Candidatus Omnitrophota bacterium]